MLEIISYRRSVSVEGVGQPNITKIRGFKSLSYTSVNARLQSTFEVLGIKSARSRRVSYLVKFSTQLKMVENASSLLYKLLEPLSECLERVIYPAGSFGSFPNALAHRSFRGVEVHSRFDFEALD